MVRHDRSQWFSKFMRQNHQRILNTTERKIILCFEIFQLIYTLYLYIYTQKWTSGPFISPSVPVQFMKRTEGRFGRTIGSSYPFTFDIVLLFRLSFWYGLMPRCAEVIFQFIFHTSIRRVFWYMFLCLIYLSKSIHSLKFIT